MHKQIVDWTQKVDASPILAIGVLAYGGVHDLIRCVTNIRANTRLPHHLCVFDNSERNRTNIRALKALYYGKMTIIDSPANVGCSMSRNRVYEYFRDKYPGLRYFAFLDQDVMVHPEWASDMIRVMQTYPKAGIVVWPQANMGRLPMREDGCVSMCASCCNMHRVAAVDAVAKLQGGKPWDERFFFYRFDSLFGQRNNQAGYRTYICLKYYKHGVDWLKQTGGITHPNPNSGIKRNPKWQEIRRKSAALYDQLKKKEGWTEFDPLREAIR